MSNLAQSLNAARHTHPGLLDSVKLRLGGASYRVLALHAGSGSSTLALVHLPDNSVTPFVTWSVDGDGNCFWGHYFHTLEEAVADFEERR